MCGIFGLLLGKDTRYTPRLLKDTFNHLFILSESRGKEAAGVAIFNNGKVSVYKEPLSARFLIRKNGYKHLFNEVTNTAWVNKNNALIREPIAIIGHTRLATNGPQIDNNNNSPIVCDDTVGVHNGIVVNDSVLWKKFPLIERKGLVDSEVIFSLLNFFNKQGLPLVRSVQFVFKNIQGSASIAAIMPTYNSMVLATNTGSLYTCKNIAGNIYIFASELPILQKFIKNYRISSVISECNITQIKAGQGYFINICNLTEHNFNFD